LQLHWSDDGEGGDQFTVSVRTWLCDVISSEPVEIAAAVADSALRNGVLRRDEWERILTACPAAKRRVLAIVDGVPESGTESILRAALWAAGIAVRAQVEIGEHRSDLLVGDRLLLEADSEGFHGGRAARIRDSKRDRALVGRGYVVLHFDYAEILYDLPAVIAEILRAVRAGAHVRAAM
jgi:very-short-patch-repair endonuclease